MDEAAVEHVPIASDAADVKVAPAQAMSPAQMVASAEAFYRAQLTKAAEPDPEAKKLREMATQLWNQADAIDGPDRRAARQKLHTHDQSMQRHTQQPRGAHQGAHVKPKAG